MSEKINNIPKTEVDIHTNNMEPDLDEQGFRHTALNRVVGMDVPYFTNTEDKPEVQNAKTAFAYFEDEMLSDKTIEGAVEIQKTPEQKDICNTILKEIPEFLKKYGLEQPVLIPESAVQFLDMKEVDKRKVHISKHNPAEWDVVKQHIHFDNEAVESSTNLDFARHLAHEIAHAQSFNSLRVRFNEEGEGFSFESRRGGLVSYSEKKDVEGNPIIDDNFADLDEALTELLARRFIKEHINQIPHVSDDVEKIKQEMTVLYNERKLSNPDQDIKLEDVETGIEYGDLHSEHVMRRESRTYKKQVHKLMDVVKTIRVTCNTLVQEGKMPENQGFIDNEAVLQVFTKAYFTGKQLEFARLLKTVYPHTSYSDIGHATRIHGKKRDRQEIVEHEDPTK